MRSILLTLTLILSLQLTHAQEQTQNGQVKPPDSEVDLYSNSEKFADSTARLISKEFVAAGHILNCGIEVLHYTDVISGERRNALRFSDPQNRQNILDEDEIEALTIAMHAINDKILPNVPPNYTEVTFKSRSGFKAGCYWDPRAKQWQPYVEIKRTGIKFIMKKADWNIFLEILDNIKKKFQ